MRVTLVRHGSTDWNAARRFQGHSDVPLNARGRAQAHEVARRLAKERFDAVVSSDLARCRQTAEIICEGKSVSIHFDKRWREAHFGVWEGLRWEEIVARGLDGDAPPGGEDFAAVRARVYAAFRELEKLEHDRVLIVTHSGPVHAVLSLFMAESAALGMRVDPGDFFSIQNGNIYRGLRKS